jgi:hypothetical protein
MGFQHIVSILDDAVSGPNAGVLRHGPFWRNITRDQFVAKKVFGRPLIVLGDGASSNLVPALKGESPFGSDLPDPPQDADIKRMPVGRPPVPADRITVIEKWIDDGCPAEDPAVADPTWRPTNAPVASSRTDDIWFLDHDRGWAVNSNGQILHTEDGFNSWQEQLLDEEADPAAGPRTIEWDGVDDNGRPAGEGQYLLRFGVDGNSESQIVHLRT